MEATPRRPVPLRLLGLLLACVSGCAEATPPAEPTPSATSARTPWQPSAPVNVIFIVVDTLRADALLDPAERYDTPNLDRFARASVVFPRAYSAAPMTLPSHMSLFSSRPPFETKVLNNGEDVPDDLPLLAQWLADNGYHTRAVISLGTLNPLDPRRGEHGPSRGFHSYDIDFLDIALAADTNRRLLASLAQRAKDEPLFLFAHFADPHEPYDAHGSEVTRIAVSRDGEPLDQVVVSDTNPWSRSLRLGPGRTVFEFQSAEDPPDRFRLRRFDCKEQGRPVPVVWELGRQMERVARARVVVDRGDSPAADCDLRFWLNDVPENDEVGRKRYALEVAYVDRHIGALLAELERQSLFEDSLVVFTSDHGEALGERKMWGHVQRLSDELIHVPLIVKLPRNDPRRDELERAAAGVVTHLDVVPTLLDVVGVPPLPGQRGSSLFEPHATVHIAETHRPEAQRTQVALRDERFKMVFLPADPEAKPVRQERFELYDLVADPQELTNVFAARKAERPDWPEKLRLIHAQSQRGFSTAGEREETEEQRAAREAMLNALGYGGGGAEQ